MIEGLLRYVIFPVLLFFCAGQDRRCGSVRIGSLVLTGLPALTGFLLDHLAAESTGTGGPGAWIMTGFVLAPGLFLTLIAAASRQRAAGLADGIVMLFIGLLYGMSVYVCFLIADAIILIRMLFTRRREAPMLPDLFCGLIITEGVQLVLHVIS